MKSRNRFLLTAAIVATLSACSSTPERIESLENARAIVTQVETSPRAGVAATNISDARKALNTANRLVETGGKLGDIEFESNIAALNAQIANEKILTAQANDEIQKGQADRQAVLIQSREREAQRYATEAEARAAEAERRAQEAREANLRAQTLEQELADLKAKKTERGLVLTLGDVLFDTGKATLKPGAYPTIERLATALKDVPARKVMIEGHTDSVGSDEFNQQLSQNRALSVQTALMERGVQSNQITTLGKGESTPIASNDDAGGRQQNRRVEMIFQEDPARVASDGA
ncbi:MAG TPA: OmpA family protein [Steroidobacteraceae bacterium]|nr:OmpA family protein [Steroidobacteraceae bacterium]